MASQTWQEAVLGDGTDVMYEVTVRLYPRNIPPQLILKKDFYNNSFDTRQRETLESWKKNGTFDIHSLARKFDISLHYAVQKNVCQLRNYGNLFTNVQRLVNKRNDIAHYAGAYPIMDDKLNEELDDLLHLYMDILDELENHTGGSLYEQKRKIRNNIESRKKQEGMSDFTNVALGVGAAAAVGVGLSALIGAFMSDGKKKETK